MGTFQAKQDITIGIFRSPRQRVPTKFNLKAGEQVDFDILDSNAQTYLEIQFYDGDTAFQVPKAAFKKLRKK